DDPIEWRSAPIGAVRDTWQYPNRQCTSFVAWRLHSRNGFEMPIGIGNANTWDDYFLARGYRVDVSPAVGAIAQTDAGEVGHVAWVEAVGRGTVTVEDYNFAVELDPQGKPVFGTYHVRVLPTTDFVYVHVKDLDTPPPPPPTTTSLPAPTVAAAAHRAVTPAVQRVRPKAVQSLPTTTTRATPERTVTTIRPKRTPPTTRPKRTLTTTSSPSPPTTTAPAGANPRPTSSALPSALPVPRSLTTIDERSPSRASGAWAATSRA